MFKKKSVYQNDPIYRMEEQQLSRGLLHNRVFKTAVLAVAILGDFWCLFSIFDLNSQSSVFLLFVESIILACVLDVTPSIFASYLSGLAKDRRTLQRFLTVILAVLAFAFLATFALSFKMRWDSREAMFGTKSGLSFDLNGDAEADPPASPEGDGITPAQTSGAIFLGMAPLLSSILVFALFWEDDPNYERRRKLRLQLAELQVRIDHTAAHCGLIRQDLTHDLSQQEEAKYRSAVALYELAGQQAHTAARRLLAERLGQSEACTALMQEPALPADSTAPTEPSTPLLAA